MLQTGSQERGSGGQGAVATAIGSLTSRLAEEPEVLERGLMLLEVGLRLTPDLVLDALFKDRTSRPVIALGEER